MLIGFGEADAHRLKQNGPISKIGSNKNSCLISGSLGRLVAVWQWANSKNLGRNKFYVGI